MYRLDSSGSGKGPEAYSNYQLLKKDYTQYVS